MSTTDSDSVRQLLESLAGQAAPLNKGVPDTVMGLLADEHSNGIGYSQLNELLILLGFDRLSHSFFQFLVDGSTDYRLGASIRTVGHLKSGIDRFREMGLLLYGNVKYAFKRLSQDSGLLRHEIEKRQVIADEYFKCRHSPVMPIRPIPGPTTHYLGYLAARELRERIDANPTDTELQRQKIELDSTIETGRSNHEAYLASDHLDVYIATSMRERHEFLNVNNLVAEIFRHPVLSNLNLRWFDPTQAYCKDRIDKGLAEALMLRRALCTIYFAQESDTLGKDSELASTLAQGKPVVAFVPDVHSSFASELVAQLLSIYPEKSRPAIILEQL